MDLSSVPLPPALAVAGWVVALPVVAAALRAVRWRRFEESGQAHLWLGGIFCLVALWSLQATIDHRFTFHLLGVAAFALTAGFAPALVGAAIATGLRIAISGAPWGNAAIAFLTMGALPVAVAWGVLRLSERFLPPNFFVYIFVGAFFGAALSLGAAGLAGATVLAVSGAVAAPIVFGEYAPFLLYLAFGEATLTGMLVTLAVVYAPQWVATFDDERYLRGR